MRRKTDSHEGVTISDAEAEIKSSASRRDRRIFRPSEPASRVLRIEDKGGGYPVQTRTPGRRLSHSKRSLRKPPETRDRMDLDLRINGFTGPPEIQRQPRVRRSSRRRTIPPSAVFRASRVLFSIVRDTGFRPVDRPGTLCYIRPYVRERRLSPRRGRLRSRPREKRGRKKLRYCCRFSHRHEDRRRPGHRLAGHPGRGGPFGLGPGRRGHDPHRRPRIQPAGRSNPHLWSRQDRKPVGHAGDGPSAHHLRLDRHRGRPAALFPGRSRRSVAVGVPGHGRVDRHRSVPLPGPGPGGQKTPQPGPRSRRPSFLDRRLVLFRRHPRPSPGQAVRPARRPLAGQGRRRRRPGSLGHRRPRQPEARQKNDHRPSRRRAGRSARGRRPGGPCPRRDRSRPGPHPALRPGDLRRRRSLRQPPRRLRARP
ncbi:MAG: hypothetical protein BWX98_02016 [Candidatus Aminicenantes bacterium ADurb.Bin147]|nr:MAG: hypothetical protein BWX98_02016 [Candidatus Aminicenantes bacterium ADurb.Bin147]